MLVIVYKNVLLKGCVHHNMFAELRGYAGTMQISKELEPRHGSLQDIQLQDMLRPECLYQQAAMWRK